MAQETSNWAQTAQIMNEAVQFIAPLVAAAVPGVGVAVLMVAKIIDGVEKGLPSAVALWNDMQAGIQPTPQQMQQYFDDYEMAYQNLDAAIKEQLSKLPPA